MIIRKIAIKSAFKHSNKLRNSLRRGVNIISINEAKKELIRITIASKIIKTSARKNLFRLRVRKELTAFTSLILRISLSIKIALFSLFGINLLLNQITISLQLLFGLLGNFLVGQQFINFCYSLKEDLLFDG